MKKHFMSLGLVAAMLVAGAALVPAEAGEANGASDEAGMLMPTPKKKTTKKSTKKTTTKKSTSKKSTTKKAATTAKAVEETTAKNEETESSSTGSSILGGLLGGLAGGSSSGSTLASALTSIFDNSKVASADKLVGTWKYAEPAVVFESNNALKNIGGKVASSAIEKKLQQQFEKVGIKKGKMKMTFDKDGNFTQTLAGKTLSGTYTTKGKNVVLTYTGGMKQMIGTTQLDGNNLLIVMEVGNLLKYASSLGKLTGNSTISSLGSLLSSYDGMEVGLKLEK